MILTADHLEAFISLARKAKRDEAAGSELMKDNPTFVKLLEAEFKRVHTVSKAPEDRWNREITEVLETAKKLMDEGHCRAAMELFALSTTRLGSNSGQRHGGQVLTEVLENSVVKPPAKKR